MSGAAPLRVALVGTGYFAHFHARAWRRIAGVDLVALQAIDPEAGSAFAETHGIGERFERLEQMLERVRPDLVDIVAPPAAHAALIGTAVGLGVATVCQKPFCTDLAEAERVVAAADAAGVTLVVHENFRFQPWYREIRRLIDADALGEIWSIRFDLRPGDGRGDDAYLDRQPYFREQKRFLIRETAVHQVDTFRYLVGEIAGVRARLRRLNPVVRGEDAGLVMFDFVSGADGLFDGNRLIDHPAREQRLTMGELRLEGSAATLSLDGDARISLRAHGEREARAHDYAWRDVDFGGDCVHATCRHVAAHLADGAPLENSARDYLANLRVEEAIYRAAESGCRETP